MQRAGVMRRMRGRWMAALALAAVSMGAAAAPGNSGVVTRAGLSIKLPANWTADAAPAARAGGGAVAARETPLVARAPTRDTDDTGEYQAVLMVSTEPGSTFDAAAQQARLAHDRNFSNYQPIEKPTAVKLAGVDAVMFGGTFTLGPLKLRSRQYMLTKNNKLYVVTFTCLASQWESYIGGIEESLGTLAIGEK